MSGTGSGDKTKAWELGRNAYLNWAVGKMVAGNTDGSSNGERSEGLEMEPGKGKGIEVLARAVGA